jgi:regulator of nucleoside diphosphate kinase
MRNRIYVTNEDMQRLRRLVDNLQTSISADSNLAALEEELDRAHVVDAKRIRPDVITLNSQVRVMDLDNNRVLEYEVVYPNTKGRSSASTLSVLAPLGTALLGYRAGDTIEWSVPRGKRRLKVLEVMYQPEAKSTSAA